MTSEDQINKGLVAIQGVRVRAQRNFIQILQQTFQTQLELCETRRRLPNKDSTLLSLPSRLRLPTILVHPFRTACSLLISDRENVNRQATITQMITI